MDVGKILAGWPAAFIEYLISIPSSVKADSPFLEITPLTYGDNPPF